MGARRRKPRPNDLTDRFRSGEFATDRLYEEEDPAKRQQFSNRSKNAEGEKIAKTSAMRAALLAAAELDGSVDVELLPTGQVTQVFSLFCEVEAGGRAYLCVTRKTLRQVSDTQPIVGDMVRIHDTGLVEETGRPEAVIEQVLPRRTVLTRSDSFKQQLQHPIVANAGHMLIVVAAAEPRPKWGLVDRMLVAAKSGGLVPVVCLNKVDLIDEPAVPAEQDAGADDESVDPRNALNHYLSIGVQTLQTSVDGNVGLGELKDLLANQTTVLAGHSGVGKSSLIRAVEPALDLRVGAISNYNGKGRHTTSSARRYPLAGGGVVIDTPGVKMFGLWDVSPDGLIQFFPDVAAGTAPAWRTVSYERIRGTIEG